MKLTKKARLALADFMDANEIKEDELLEILREECKTIAMTCRYCGESVGNMLECDKCGGVYCEDCESCCS